MVDKPPKTCMVNTKYMDRDLRSLVRTNLVDYAKVRRAMDEQHYAILRAESNRRRKYDQMQRRTRVATARRRFACGEVRR